MEPDYNYHNVKMEIEPEQILYIVMGAGMLVAIGIRSVPTILSLGNGKKSSDYNKTLNNMENDIKHLMDIHSKTDEDGIPVWYVPRSLVKGVQELNDRQKEHISIARSILDESRKTRTVIENMVIEYRRKH